MGPDAHAIAQGISSGVCFSCAHWRAVGGVARAGQQGVKQPVNEPRGHEQAKWTSHWLVLDLGEHALAARLWGVGQSKPSPRLGWHPWPK